MMDREQKHTADLLALAERCEAVPSRKLAALTAFGAWSLTMFGAILLQRGFGITDAAVELISTVGVGLGFAAYWEIRFSAASKLADELRARASS